MADYESVLCVKNEVFVFRIPPRPSNRGYRAADWKLDAPDWTGRMKIVAKGKELNIRLEDKNSGELFAKCPVESYPGAEVEQVLDSSRYFVIRIKDEGGRSASIGLGFADRGDSFDLLVSLQDHFKLLKREEKQAAEEEAAKFDTGPKLDLGFKEGQTIRINIQTKKGQQQENDGVPKSRPRMTGGGMGLLPPPPGGVKIAGPPRGAGSMAPPPVMPPQQQQSTATFSKQQSQPASGLGQSSSGNSNVDLLCDFGVQSQAVQQPTQQQQSLFVQPVAGVSDPWSDLTGIKSGGSSTAPSSTQNNSSSGDGGWVSFD